MIAIEPSAGRPGPSTTEQRVATLFGLQGDAWLRHANPWSVWTRFTCVSLIAAAVWSRTWIGWYCLIPVAAAVLWTVFNPRLFGVPASTENWASKAVLGERLYTERRTTPIPVQFSSAVPNVANAISTVGLAMVVYGLVASAVWPLVAGILVVHTAKLWYLDRMVLLYDDVTSQHGVARQSRTGSGTPFITTGPNSSKQT